jgi:hypothetical protein
LLYRLCDEAVAQDDASRDDRETYVYREGFYRRLWFSLLARAQSPGAALGPRETQQPIPVTVFWFFGIVCAAGALLSYERIGRFRGYKVRQAVLGFAALLTRGGGSRVCKFDR